MQFSAPWDTAAGRAPVHHRCRVPRLTRFLGRARPKLQGIPVRALVRDGVKASAALPPSSQGVEIVEGDVYKFSTLAKAMEGW